MELYKKRKLELPSVSDSSYTLEHLVQRCQFCIFWREVPTAPWDCQSFSVVRSCSSGFWSQLSGFLFWHQKTFCKLTFTEITVTNLVSSLDFLSPSASKITLKAQQTMKMVVFSVRVCSQLPVFSFSGGHPLKGIWEYSSGFAWLSSCNVHLTTAC